MIARNEELKQCAKRAGVVLEYPKRTEFTEGGLPRQRQYVGRSSVKTAEVIEKHAKEIVERLNKGETISDLSKRYGLSRPTMHEVLRRIGKWVFVGYEQPKERAKR